MRLRRENLDFSNFKLELCFQSLQNLDFQNRCPSPKIIGEWSAVCDAARVFKVALLAVGVGQGWEAVDAV